MRKELKIPYMVIIAGIALLGLTALGVAGDPDDTTTQPTEDWVFDSGAHSYISGENWTMSYNITVTNDSTLTIEECNLTFNSSNPNEPNWILLVNGSLNLLRSEFINDEGSPGFYIETHNLTKISSCIFEGLGYNPVTEAGISIYDTNATLEFVTINGTAWMTSGVWSMDSNLTIDHSNFWNIDATAISFNLGSGHFNVSFNLQIVESEILDVGGDGIAVRMYTCYSNAFIDCYKVDIRNAGDDGVAIDHRFASNGSVYATFDDVHIDTVGNMGLYLSTVDAIASTAGQNVYNVTFVNSTLTNTTDTGFYVQMYRSPVIYNMVIENSNISNIAQDPLTSRLSGVYYWYYLSTGSAYFYAGNTTFYNCAPYAFEANDMNVIDELRFFNCTIIENEEAGLAFEVASSGAGPLIFIENCTIEDNDGPGVYYFINGYSSSQPVVVVNTTLTNNKGAALMIEGASYDGKGFGFNVTGCNISDHDGPAISVNYIELAGNVFVYVTNTTITDTKGILLNLGENYNENPDLFLSLVNTTMTNIDSHAVSLSCQAYYSSFDAFITLESSTLTNIDGSGLYLDAKKEYYYYDPSFMLNVKILNSTIEKLTGNGLFLSLAEPESKGTRNFTMVNSQILSARKGIYATNFDGEIWYSTFSDNLKEDMIAINARINVHYTDLDEITEDKFKAVGMGEIKFIFDLVVFVKWDTGIGAVGASVRIMDNTQKLISVQTVREEDGSVPIYTMTPYMVIETGIFSSSPYVITVEFMGMEKTEGVRLTKNQAVYIILEDHIEPDIVMLYPDTGHVQQSTELEVRGSAWDAQSGVVSVQISLDGNNWIVAEGSWIQWNLTIEVSDELIRQFGGYFVLRAKAIDSAGNEAEAFAIIRVDPTPPELKIDFPLNGYVTNNPEIYVRGVTELGSTVKVNGEIAELLVSMFNHRLELLEGPNSITVVSVDPLGNIEIKTLTVTLDTQDPYLILISPEMDEITNQEEILVQAQVEEGLTVYINGYPIEYGSEYYPVGEGVIEYPVSLEPGENPIVISAIDKAGNAILVERTVTLDHTPPWISVTAPLDGERLSRPEVTVKGTVEPGVQLFVMDEDVETGNGYFERVILALEGENEIILKAIDPAGNEYTETVTIFVDTVPPVLIITDPVLDMITVGERRFYINGSIGLNENGELTDDRLLLNEYGFTTLYDETGVRMRVPIEIAADGTFTISVDLEQGRNDLTIEVLDPVGNVARATRTVYLDALAPTLVLYMDPVMRDDAGEFYTHALTLNLTGYTNPGSELRILDILVGVAPDGTFQINLDLVPEDDTTIVVTSKNTAGNTRMVEETVTQTKVGPASTEDEGLGTWFLVTALVIFVVVALIAFMLVRTRREDYIEMQAAEETPLADLESVDHDIEVESGVGPGGVDEPDSAPPRPRPSHPSRPVKPEPEPPGEPEITEKDLTEQEAESDIGAHETEQEGN